MLSRTRLKMRWWREVMTVLLVLQTITHCSPVNLTVTVNQGGSAILTCGPNSGIPPYNNSIDVLPTHQPTHSSFTRDSSIEWILPGKANTSGSLIRDVSGDLFITNVGVNAEGEYTCTKGNLQYHIHVNIRRVPSRVFNLTVSSHSIYATVSWSVVSSAEVDGFLCMFRKDTSRMKNVEGSDLIFINSTQSLGPESRTCDFYDLKPNHTYFVKVAAYNSAGVGDFVSTQMKTTVLVHTDDHSAHRILVTMATVSILIILLLGTLIGFIYIRLYKKYSDHQPVSPFEDLSPEDDSLELVPHITLNPAFNIEMLEHISPDYNESSEHAFLVEKDEKDERSGGGGQSKSQKNHCRPSRSSTKSAN